MDRGRLPRIAGVLLVGKAEQQYLRAFQRKASGVKRQHQPVHDVVWHVAVDVVGQLDKPEALAQGALDPPGQIGRVDGKTVATYAGPGVNGMKPNGFVEAARMASQTSMSRS